MCPFYTTPVSTYYLYNFYQVCELKLTDLASRLTARLRSIHGYCQDLKYIALTIFSVYLFLFQPYTYTYSFIACSTYKQSFFVLGETQQAAMAHTVGIAVGIICAILFVVLVVLISVLALVIIRRKSTTVLSMKGNEDICT